MKCQRLCVPRRAAARRARRPTKSITLRLRYACQCDRLAVRKLDEEHFYGRSEFQALKMRVQPVAGFADQLAVTSLLAAALIVETQFLPIL
jgi:hypothetical protein